MKRSIGDQIAELLRARGPLVAEELIGAIISADIANSSTSARQQMRRAVATQDIKSTDPVLFGKGFLYFHPKHANGNIFSKSVLKNLELRPGFHRVFKTLLANKGWITLGQIAKASASLPSRAVQKRKNRQTLDEVVEHLQHLRMLEEDKSFPGLFFCGDEYKCPVIQRARFIKSLELDQELLEKAVDWLRNCYQMAYDRHNVRDSWWGTTQFNNSHWDLNGPMYLGPLGTNQLATRVKGKTSFLVAEILTYRPYTEVDAQSVIARYQAVVGRWKSIPVVACIVSRTFSKAAWNQLREAGLTPVTLENVFGSNLHKLMEVMAQLFTGQLSNDEVLTKVGEALRITEGTEANEGLSGNLRGTLFELIIAHAFKNQGYATELQKKLTKSSTSESYEIDIVATKPPSEALLIECKGRHSDYREEEHEIEKHFKRRVAAAVEPYGYNVRELYDSVKAIFITSGLLEGSAKDFADATKKSHGVVCETWDRKSLNKALQEHGETELLKLLDRYY